MGQTQQPVAQPAEMVSSSEETLSRRKAKKAQKMTKNIKSVPGSVDVRVQHTNDDSVVSKRSAVAMNYFNDPFLRHFVKKPTRRAPLINRGYYLRMLVMTDVITAAINRLHRLVSSRSDGSDSIVQVISLGAGYDTFAFRTLLSEECGRHENEKNTMRATCATLCEGVLPHLRFYDVDFPAVMQAKAALMAAAPPDAFAGLQDLVINPADAEHPVSSAQYNAVGIDLREPKQTLLSRIEEATCSSSFSTSLPTVVYAECVMQYMPPEAARDLIAFIAATFPHAVFVAYDQLHPADSFGSVMMGSLRQKNSPLLGINAAPDGTAMTRRALDAGMCSAFFANFYDLTRHHIGAEEEARLKSLEAFDELEEWAEMCEHYGITLGLTSEAVRAACVAAPSAHDGAAVVFENPAYVEGKTAVASASAPTASLSVLPSAAAYRPWPSSRFAFEGWGNGEAFVEQHPTDPRETVVITVGGFCVSGKVSQRVNTVHAHGMRGGEMKVVAVTSDDPTSKANAPPPPLVLHSVSRLAPFVYVIFGGRSNPETAFGDAYLLRVAPQPIVGGEAVVVVRWRRLAVAEGDEGMCGPAPRYRHAAATLPGPSPRIAVCCGRDATTIFGDAWIGHVDVDNYSIRWERFWDTCALPAVCSPALTVMPRDTGDEHPTRLLLSGGIDASGCCNANGLLLNVDTQTVEVAPHLPGGAPLLCDARFAHSVTPVDVDGASCLLILGGCASNEKQRVMPSTAVLVDSNFQTPPVTLTLPEPCPTSIARHSVVQVAAGMVAVIGGGYTCFSFGTFTSRPFILCLGEAYDACPPWSQPQDVCSSEEAPTDAAVTSTTLPVASGKKGHRKGPMYPSARLLSFPRPPVEEQVYSPAAFHQVVQAATRPVVFRRVDLGPCLQRWRRPAYLKEAEKDAVVSVHVASAKGTQTLDFVRKNFTFRHVSFPQLVEHIEQCIRQSDAKEEKEETWYFRSVAHNMKTDRANLWTDFPHLGNDFALPEGAREFVMPRLHQSCLRLNAAPLQLWTHYDTFDNVLCQVVGRKRVVMFPPSEFNNLYISGSSSPVLNIDYPDLCQYPRFIDACKRATEVILDPGDMLYFPANWFHHITTLTDEDPASNGSTVPSDPYSVSVNLFFAHFDQAVYDAKDLYGNKDIPAVVELRQAIHEHARQAITAQRVGTTGEALPKAYAQFALRQAIQDLEKLADEMGLEAGL